MRKPEKSTFGITMIVLGNEISDPGSNPGGSCLHITWCWCSRERHETISSTSHSNCWYIVLQSGFFSFGKATGLGEGNE